MTSNTHHFQFPKLYPAFVQEKSVVSPRCRRFGLITRRLICSVIHNIYKRSTPLLVKAKPVGMETTRALFTVASETDS